MPHARDLTPAQRTEYDELLARGRVLAEFVDELMAAEYAARSGGTAGPLPFPLADAFDDSAERPGTPREWLAGLREAFNDLVEMSEDLDGGAVRRLDARLRERCGVSLDALHARRLGRLERLRAKGRLATEEQYHLVRGRLEQVWDDAARAEEARQLTALIADFERRVAERLARRKGAG